MEILMGNLFIVYISSIFARLDYRNKRLETNYKNYNKIFILLALASLIVVSGFRYKSGTDFNTYAENFYQLANTKTINLKDYNDTGFVIVCMFLLKISRDPQIMFFTISIVTNILIVYVLMKESKRFELSMWLFITTFVYYSTFNGLRQWLAAAIVFAGTGYLIKERNFIKYLLIVLIASLFHASVLIMIPIYFFINSSTFSFRNLLMILCFMFAVFAYSKFLPILANVLEGTQYANYIQVFENNTDGINPIRLIVYFIPVGMSCFYYRQINPEKDIQIDRIINLCVIGFLVMFLALRQIFFARLIFYFDLYYLLLIPRLIDIGDKKFKRLLYYSIAIGYFAFSYVLLITGQSGIIPYTFKMTLF